MRFLPEPKVRRRGGLNNREDLAVCGRNNKALSRRRRPFRVPKECHNPDDHRQSNPAHPSRKSKQEGVRDGGERDERPAGPMNDRLFQIVTCVPISTTRLGGSR